VPLYSVRTLPDAFTIGVRITKFDTDLNVVTTYEVTAKTCTCPAGVDRRCKHRSKFPTLRSIADTGKFFCFETMSVVSMKEIQEKGNEQ
jgi:hypothetical protein